jgi:hypothetical protein
MTSNDEDEDWACAALATQWTVHAMQRAVPAAAIQFDVLFRRLSVTCTSSAVIRNATVTHQRPAPAGCRHRVEEATMNRDPLKTTTMVPLFNLTNDYDPRRDGESMAEHWRRTKPKDYANAYDFLFRLGFIDSHCKFKLVDNGTGVMIVFSDGSTYRMSTEPAYES